MKCYRKIFTIVLLLCSVVLARDTVTVSTDTWPPFRIGNSPNMNGIDLDFLKELGNEMNITFVVLQSPWARCLVLMENGQTDMMVGLAYTEERSRYVTYTKNPYYVCHPAFYVKKGSGVKINSYSDLKKYSIGYARSSAYFEPFNSDMTLKKVDITDENSMLKMVLLNRVQTIVGTDVQVDYDLASRGLTDSIERAPYRPDSPTKLFVAVSKKSKFIGRIDELNRAVDKMIAQKRPQALAAKYFKPVATKK